MSAWVITELKNIERNLGVRMQMHETGFTNNTTHPHNTWLREGVQAGDVRTTVVDLNNRELSVYFISIYFYFFLIK